MKDNNRGWLELVNRVMLSKYCTVPTLRDIVNEVAEVGKETLDRMKKLHATAFVLTVQTCEMINLRFYNPKEKDEAYDLLGVYSNKIEAHSIIVLQDAEIEYDGGKTDALLTLVLSQRLRDYALVDPYFRHKAEGGKELLYFMDQERMGSAFMSELGNWWH